MRKREGVLGGCVEGAISLFDGSFDGLEMFFALFVVHVGLAPFWDRFILEIFGELHRREGASCEGMVSGRLYGLVVGVSEQR